MYIDYLSASRLNVYIDCPFRYFLQYHLMMQELQEDTIHTTKGSAVHEILEKYALGDTAYTDNLKKYYSEHKLWTLDDRKPDKGFPHPVKKNCSSCPWSNGKICSIADRAQDIVDGCPKPNFEDDLGLLKDTILSKKSILKRKILGVEKEFIKEYDGFKVKGYIDIITEIDKDTIEIGDYKTGTYAKTTEDAFKDIQLRTYSMVGKELFPGYKYTLMTLHYLRKKPVTIIFDENDDEKTRNFLRSSYQKIKNAVNPIRKKSFKCNWCVGYDACGKFKEMFMENGKFVLPPPVNPKEKKDGENVPPTSA